MYPLIYTCDFHFNSVTGVQQGDPLGPFLFSIALQEPLVRLTEHIAEKHQDCPKAELLTFYIDDGVLVARHEVLQTVLEFLDSQSVKGYGFHLTVQKCSVW